MFEEAKLKITEKLRATLLVLYSLGCKILEGKIDTLLNELVENAELLDKLTGIGSKVEIKYPKSNNEHIIFALMIENVGDAEKMSGQLLTEIIDKIMHEVVGNEGGWGYVKSDKDETNKISKEELINEEIE
uniref:Uncharacterized protein n=1 Tax=Meloidogyne floridensis TaxID=298350 RepID=A0A915NAT2_9BILA